MEKFVFLIANLLLIYHVHSSPTPQLHPQQNSLYPSYFYEQVPFIYSPLPNPWYTYNYLGPVSSKFATKSEDKKSTQQDARAETKSSKPSAAPNQYQDQVPLLPFVQYIPAYYGRNLDSWSAKEIPVTVIVDENFEKSYNVPYAFQHPYVRNYVELSKQNPQPVQSSPSIPAVQPTSPVQTVQPGHAVSSDGDTITVKTSQEAAQFIDVRSSPIDKSRYAQGAPLIPNVASINTPQASISFFPHYQGLSYARDLPTWNVNEIPISALVVDEAVDKNTEKDTEKHAEKSDDKISNPSPL